jgi:hypothetical protein
MEITESENASAFNEAMFKMKRLHELQQICNDSRASPVARDDNGNTGILNHYNALLSLYQEVSSKLKKDEKKIKPTLLGIGPKVRALNQLIPSNYTQTDKVAWYRSKEGKTMFNEVIDEIFEVEELIRKYLDDKGFSTLNAENLEGDQYN